MTDPGARSWTPLPITTGRLYGYAGVTVGLTISVTANVMATNGRPEHQWWSPWLGGSWPLMLFLALEIITRTEWGTGRTRGYAIGGAGLIAAIAATASYTHLRELLIAAGEPVWLATLEPLVIDGLMTTSAAALLVSTTRRHGTPQDAPQEPAGTLLPPRPTTPSQPVSTQASTGTITPGPTRQPVSRETLDKVLAALHAGEPMSTGQIVNATGVGRSTVARAVSQLLADGLLMSAVGVDPRRPTDPYYSLPETVTAPTR